MERVKSTRPVYCFPVGRSMKEVTRSNDLVFLSWARTFLADSGISTLVLDGHTSMIEGSIGAIQRRLMVADQDYQRAISLLREATEPSA